MFKTIVEAPAGKIEGKVIDKSAIAFLGIPYAEPPVGDLRFRAPRPLKPFNSLFKAFEFSKIAPQPEPSPITALPGDPKEWDEDCLTLNIFRPAADDVNLPVMVFIHGGGFVSGSSSSQLYWGKNFVKNNVILVTINYRLGALGFLALEELAEDDGSFGNYGLKDQLQAIRWVKENIEAFGGDKTRVCVFGESAGSMSIANLLITNEAENLIDAAILQSGPALAAKAEAAFKIGNHLAKVLGVDQISKKALSKIEAAAFISAQSALATTAASLGLPFQPVVDGVFVKDNPLEIWKAGKANPVPIIVGTNKDEMHLFLMGFPKLHDVSVDEVRSIANQFSGAFVASNFQNAGEKVDAYRKLLGDDMSALDLFSTVLTDAFFRIPSVFMANGHSKQSPVYLYRFDWESPFLNGGLKACHALELPFVFNNLDNPAVGAFAGKDKAGAHELAISMGALWSEFANKQDLDSSKILAWKRFSTARKPSAVFDANIKIVENLDSEILSIWEDS